jgi:hypothetical protein
MICCCGRFFNIVGRIHGDFSPRNGPVIVTRMENYVMFISRFAVGILWCAGMSQCCCEKGDPTGPGKETAEPDRSDTPPPGAIEATELNVRVRELVRQGNLNEALPLAQRASQLDKKAFGPNHKFVAQSLGVLGYVEMELGRYADAEAHFNEALPIQAAAIGMDDVEYARTLDDLGQVQGRTGRSLRPRTTIVEPWPSEKNPSRRITRTWPKASPILV